MLDDTFHRRRNRVMRLVNYHVCVFIRANAGIIDGHVCICKYIDSVGEAGERICGSCFPVLRNTCVGSGDEHTGICIFRQIDRKILLNNL